MYLLTYFSWTCVGLLIVWCCFPGERVVSYLGFFSNIFPGTSRRDVGLELNGHVLFLFGFGWVKFLLFSNVWRKRPHDSEIFKNFVNVIIAVFGRLVSMILLMFECHGVLFFIDLWVCMTSSIVIIAISEQVFKMSGLPLISVENMWLFAVIKLFTIFSVILSNFWFSSPLIFWRQRQKANFQKYLGKKLYIYCRMFKYLSIKSSIKLNRNRILSKIRISST